MILNKFLALLCFTVMLLSCSDDQDSNTGVTVDTTAVVPVLPSTSQAAPQFKPHEYKDIDSTLFEGVILPGSTAMVISPLASVYSDTSCSEKKVLLPLVRGDKVRVKGDLNVVMEGYHQPIYKIIFEDEGQEISGYMKQRDLAFYFKSLPDGRTILSGFTEPYHEKNRFLFQGVLLITDARYREVSSVVFPLTDTLEDNAIEHSYNNPLYMEAGIEGELRHTQNLGQDKPLILIRTYYNFCNYYSEDRMFIESNGVLKSLPELHVGSSDDISEGYEMIWPGEPEGAVNKITVKLYKKNYFYSAGKDPEIQTDSTLIRYGWDDQKGITSVDTIYKKIHN